MLRLRGLSALAFGTILIGLATLNGVLLALAIPLVLFILSGLLTAPQSSQIQIQRVLERERAGILADVELKVRVTNAGEKLEEVHLSQIVPPSLEVVDGASRFLLSLNAGQTIELTLILKGARGSHVFPEIRTIAMDHFHLWRKSQQIEAPTTLTVLPRALPLKRVEIRPRRTRGYSGQIPTRLGGPGIDFFGVRSYEPGDPMHSIDWKTSARHVEELFTKQFEQQRVADISIILDARKNSEITGTHDSLLEYSILATAALAETFLGAGNRVGLLVYGELLDWTFPRYGKIQAERILQKLAQTQPGDSPVFSKLENLPMRLLPPSSQLVFVGPLLAEDVDMLTSIPGRGFPLLLVSPDPVDYASNNRPESDLLEHAVRIARIERALSMRKLKQAGVQVVDWQVDIPFKQVASANLSHPPMWLRSLGVES